ncbi:MAG: response regulator [Candidatus Gastranaerophilales bacterium]|nr:response regulator [Candidatus Gastranaerophilales bacterium]
MYKARVLIISDKKEQSIKYKKLIEVQNQDVVITNNLSDALSVIQKQEVEFIIISDSISERLSDFIKKIRVLTFNSRPIIIAVSKSGDLNDRLEILDSGADDIIGEEISKQEFQMRFKAHLRRYLETFLNPHTQLSDKNITIKAIKKSFELDEDISYLLIKIKNIDLYRKTHGEIAYEKVLQTLGAIINSTFSQNNYAGHVNDDELILITNTIQAEKIASFLAFAFDNILNKFYSTDDFENNFSIQYDDGIKEIKTGLMRLNISAIERSKNKLDYNSILNSLRELVELCYSENASTYIVDRFRLKGETAKKENKVLVLEPDMALSCLLENVCKMNGFSVQVAYDEEEFLSIYEQTSPSVVVLDWGMNEQNNNLEVAQKISKDNVKLIFTSSYLNKKEILKAGADLYIPKPYEIDDILYWIKKFLG